ncbi:MAG: hypothetical protein GYA47_00345 [Desulfovibrio sp.]|nr:hypothetical protein [Desulfovibrio sp.]
MLANKKAFSTGLVLLISFAGVFFLIMMPIFGDGRTGLDFSDDLFNKLSKGSSYFIPEVREAIKPFAGKQAKVSVKMKSEDEAKVGQAVLAKAGFAVPATGDTLAMDVDLGKLLAKVVDDADLMYKDEGAKVGSFYGLTGDADGKKAMKTWWGFLAGMIKPLQKEKQVPMANAVNLVNQKAIEPAYNFYGIKAESILDKIPTASALLIFYVVYTMWYGFAIFEIFNGIGLSMSKSKIKKEV